MPAYELNVQDYLRIIRKRRYIIIFTTAGTIFFTLVFTKLQTPVYQASTTVKIEQKLSTSALLTEWVTWNPGEIMSTATKIIKSRPIAEMTARKMELIHEKSTPREIEDTISNIQSRVDAKKVGDSSILEILTVSTDPKDATKLANTVASVYKEWSLEERNKDTIKLRKFTEEQLEEIKTKLVKAEDELKKFSQRGKATGVGGTLAGNLVALEMQKAELLKKYTEKHPDVINIQNKMDGFEKQMRSLPKEDVELARLTRELRVNEDLYNMLNKKFKEVQITEAESVETVSIINPAFEPSSPIRPNKPLNLMMGTIIGFLLGFTLAFVRESMDTSITTLEDVEAFTEIPVLGVIPHIESEEEREILKKIKGVHKLFYKFKHKHKKDLPIIRKNLVIYHSPTSPLMEAYHTFRINVKFATMKLKESTLLFTSAGPQEGKTLTATNFALTAASAGLRTLLVETDLRRPMIAKFLGLNREPGLSDVILGNYKWQKVLKGTADFLIGEIELEKLLKMPGIENLKIITSGHIPPNPIDILSSDEMLSFIEDTKNFFDMVIFDCPPVMTVADALILGAKCNGVILVYQVGKMARGALKRTKQQLEQSNAKVLGVLLNDIQVSEMKPLYGYYYSYKYYSEKKPEEKVKS